MCWKLNAYFLLFIQCIVTQLSKVNQPNTHLL